MTSSWRRTLGNVRSFIGNSMGGLRGGSNLASWVVAGTLAYFLWVKPSQDLKREQQEKAALAASQPDPYRYVETRKPIPDPQVTGLVYGNKNKDNPIVKMEVVTVRSDNSNKPKHKSVFGYRMKHYKVTPSKEFPMINAHANAA